MTVAPLARTLARRTVVTLGTLGLEGRARSLAAIDEFLAAPGPAAFLAAMRVLATEERSSARRRLEKGAAARAFDDGLAALAEAGLAPEWVAVLARQPVVPGLGARLEALAALVEVHGLLTAKAQVALRALRAQLGRKATPRRIF